MMLEKCSRFSEKWGSDRKIVYLSYRFEQREVYKREQCERRLIYNVGKWESVLGR